MTDVSILRDLLILVVLGVVVVVLLHRLHLPPIIGFLFTGVLCGPYGLKLIGAVHEVEILAEIGVILLLFTVGIEFSLDQIVRLRKFVLAGGILQLALTIPAIFLLAWSLGIRPSTAIFLGMLVTLSSTAILIRLLGDRAEIDTPHGRAAMGILIFQDLCVVPMVLLIPFLAGRAGGWSSVVVIVLKAVLFVAATVMASRYLVPWILRQVVHTRQREVFLLTVIFLCLGTAGAAAALGLSLALGAFIAGLVVSESEYSHQALGQILPLRDAFNSLFFVSVGMLFDARSMLATPLLITGSLIVIVLIKSLITASVTIALGYPLRIGVVTGLALAQVGEFSFVLAKQGIDFGLIDPKLNQLFLATAVVTMALTPGFLAIAPKIAKVLELRLSVGCDRRRMPMRAPELETDSPAGHVLIVGYGLNGRNLARVLKNANIPYVIVEMNPETVRNERRLGTPIVYGDSTHPEVLEHAGIKNAKILVIAVSDRFSLEATVALARRLNPALHIIARTRYVQEVPILYKLGAHEIVPEEFETSIEIFSRVLQKYEVPEDVIEKSVREVRKGGYEILRFAIDDDYLEEPPK